MAREHYAAPGPPPPAFEPKGQVRVSLLAGPGVALTAMDEAPNSEDARSTAFLKRGSRIRPGMHMHRFVAQANRSTTRFSTNEAPPCLGEVALFADAMLHNFQAKLLERRIEPQRRAFHMAAFPARASRHSPLMPGQNGRRGHYPPSTDGIYSVFPRATITRIV